MNLLKKWQKKRQGRRRSMTAVGDLAKKRRRRRRLQPRVTLMQRYERRSGVDDGEGESVSDSDCDSDRDRFDGELGRAISLNKDGDHNKRTALVFK